MIAESRGSSKAVRRRPGRRLVTVIVILAAVWVLALFYRMEIRAHWWVYRLRHVDSAQQRQYYLACLTSIGDESLTALPRLLDDPRAEVRLWGVRLLGGCPNERVRDLLLTRVADESDEVSAGAALELARRPDRLEVMPILCDRLRSADSRAARMAAAAIERIGGPQAEAVLLERLTTADDVDLLAQVIDSLGMLASRPAIPAFVSLLADQRAISTLPASQRRVKRVIARVQGQLTAEGIDPRAVLDATHSEPTIASVAARALFLITGVSSGDPTTQPGN